MEQPGGENILGRRKDKCKGLKQKSASKRVSSRERARKRWYLTWRAVVWEIRRVLPASGSTSAFGWIMIVNNCCFFLIMYMEPDVVPHTTLIAGLCEFKARQSYTVRPCHPPFPKKQVCGYVHMNTGAHRGRMY